MKKICILHSCCMFITFIFFTSCGGISYQSGTDERDLERGADKSEAGMRSYVRTAGGGSSGGGVGRLEGSSSSKGQGVSSSDPLSSCSLLASEQKYDEAIKCLGKFPNNPAAQEMKTAIQSISK